MISKLRELGFERIEQLPQSRRIEIEKGVFVEIVPPMNSSGLDFDTYHKEAVAEIAIDTGIIFEIEKTKLVLLSDNTPYYLKDMDDSIDRMKNCDLLAFNYNGAAGEYPLCYKIPFEKKKVIQKNNEEKRENAILEFIKKIAPRYLLPYSSEFVVMGPMAKEFAKLHSDSPWSDKKIIADRYQKKTGIPSFFLYEDDEMIIEQNEFSVAYNTKSIPSLQEVADRYFSSSSPVTSIYPKTDIHALEDDFAKATTHLFDRCNLYKLKPKMSFVVTLSDYPELNFVINFSNETFTRSEHLPENYERCWLPSNYLHAILKRKSSWNAAILSFQTEWERKPGNYDNDLHYAINFLTLPRN